MISGLRTHKSATLRVAEALCLPGDMQPLCRELIDVRSTEPRRGDATALMWTVCTEADKWWMTLIIQPKKFADGMPEEKLIPWYSKFGFVQIQDEPPLMARSPQIPKIQVAH